MVLDVINGLFVFWTFKGYVWFENIKEKKIKKMIFLFLIVL